ncbi:hypothetical protein FH133_00570 [Staphylococcus hominis]|uniref:hypothetical protein n=1 Tax=Staphylococcus hominis TaxID=1290 RepID=UPI001F5774C7|nr:hypothetical protein [Staphylococcus hominis]MCI2919798.1 hypothetical protein [Staphylococcus hominis]MDS3915128.1 hypothetical protein [Staphylococcus hominis]
MNNEADYKPLSCALSGKELVDIIYKHMEEESDRVNAQLIALSIADLYEPITYHFVTNEDNQKIEEVPIIMIEDDEKEFSDYLADMFEFFYFTDHIETNMTTVLNEIIEDLRKLHQKKQNEQQKISKPSITINKEILKVIIKSELQLELPPPFAENFSEEAQKFNIIANKIIEKIENYDYDNLSNHFNIKDFNQNDRFYRTADKE